MQTAKRGDNGPSYDCLENMQGQKQGLPNQEAGAEAYNFRGGNMGGDLQLQRRKQDGGNKF
ncbi:hypothetical protein H6P81_017696 [Aristolochia fimbriata]|uniref:Uncharacterized protein n=1 Tax=Aristolochia fimbriata TaxID=158543 RepID=A0AAV7E1Y2_ARIFI|nr:hypothetical protein H6P81_017696 [Aristolochia fimbriata]